MMVWCHGTNCDNIIRNDDYWSLDDLEPGNRTHVQVQGVPFCMDCYEIGPTGEPLVCGVPVDEKNVTTVLGGYPVSENEVNTDR